MMKSQKVLIGSILGAALTVSIAAQQKAASPADSSPAVAPAQQVTVAKPLTEKQKKANEKKLKKELETPYKKWLNEEVVWIITPEERSAFGRLKTDDERQAFIDQFWLRRDPTPDTEENEFKEEHYRRIAFSNDNFASGIPGWKTDRGMVYVKYGAPDEREEHPTGGPGQRDLEEGGGETTFFPYERWRYRYIDGVGTNVMIEFVDDSMSNEYRMTWNPSDKDALTQIPGAGLTLYEQMGISNKTDRLRGTNYMNGVGDGPLSGTSAVNQWDKLNQFVNLQKAPEIKFKDLDGVAKSSIKYDLLPMQVHVDYIPVTETSVLTSITVVFNRKDLQFSQKDKIAEANINLRISADTITRRHVFTDEKPLPFSGPAENLAQLSTGTLVYNTTRAMAPGKYKLSIIAKDTVSQNLSATDIAVEVPQMYEGELANSSLILADVLNKVDSRSLGVGQFVIGSTKVRPRVGETFHRDETLGIYMQVYNFQPDATTHKPKGSVTYEITQNGTGKKVLEFTEDVGTLGGGAAQMVIEKKLKLDGFAPGEYTIDIKVNDSERNESIVPSAKFKVI